jgi:hypothetical protein
VKEAVGVLGIEFSEILKVFQTLLSQVLWNKGNDMEVIVPRLVHDKLLRRDQTKGALEKVENLLQ